MYEIEIALIVTSGRATIERLEALEASYGNAR